MADYEGETIRPIIEKILFVIIPAKVLGLLPLRIHRNRLTRDGLLGRMCSIFIMVVFLLIAIWCLWIYIQNLQLYEMDQIINPRFLAAVNLAGDLVVVITHVYREFTNAETGLQIIKSLAQYDSKVKQLGLARKDHFLFTWIITLSIIPPLLAKIWIYIEKGNLNSIETYFGVSGQMIMTIACHLARLKFCIIIHLLYQRYNHLNEIVLPKDEWRFRGNLTLNRRSVNIHDLVYLHSMLTRATKILNEVYSVELLVWIGSPIWEFIRALYHVQKTSIYGIEGFIKAAQILMAIWSLCWICETTANEANKFSMQILKTDPELIHARDIDEQLDAALYMYHNKIIFRLFNLSDINVPILVFVSLFKYERIAIGSMTLSMGSIIFDGQHGLQDYKKRRPA